MSAVIVLRPSVITGVLLVLFSACYVVLHALYCLYCGLHKVNLNWTNEVTPIKQSMSVMFAIFGGFGYAILLGGLYFLLFAFLSVNVYLILWLVINVLLSLLLYSWINNKGVKIFEEL